MDIRDLRTRQRSALGRSVRGASGSVHADGSIAMLGSPSPTRVRPACRTSTSLTFVLPDSRGNSIDVEVVRPTDTLSELVKLFDD